MTRSDGSMTTHILCSTWSIAKINTTLLNRNKYHIKHTNYKLFDMN